MQKNTRISTYLRHRARTGRTLPFPPPLPSPKDTGDLGRKQRAFLALWGVLWRAYPLLRPLYRPEPPLFLIGCHNSGTTILANLIGQHPAVANWSEAPEVWAPDDSFLNWSVLPEPPRPLPFLFDLAPYIRTAAAHGGDIPTIQRAFTLFAMIRRQPRFLNKNPHISISIPYIEAAFPNARYIYIRRNGYAVAQSLLSNWRPVLKQVATPGQSSPWARLRQNLPPAYFEDPLTLVRRCARYWQELDDWAWRDLQALPDQNRITYTTYEDMCAEPESVLRGVFRQHDLDENRYDWGQLHQPSRYPWTEMLPMENRNFKYRERLSAAEIAAITEEVGPALARHGYLHSG